VSDGEGLLLFLTLQIAVGLFGSGLNIVPRISWSKPRWIWFPMTIFAIGSWQYSQIQGKVERKMKTQMTMEQFSESFWIYRKITSWTDTDGYAYEMKVCRYVWLLVALGGLFPMCLFLLAWYFEAGVFSGVGNIVD
jgi:hypothetical protein